MFPWLTKNNGHLRVYEFWQTYTPAPPQLAKDKPLPIRFILKIGYIHLGDN